MSGLKGLSEKEVDLIRFCVLQYRFQVLREAASQRTTERSDPWGDAIGVLGDSHWSYDYAQRLQSLADKIGRAAKPRPSLMQRVVEWVTPAVLIGGLAMFFLGIAVGIHVGTAICIGVSP